MNQLFAFKPIRVPASRLPDPDAVEKYLGEALKSFAKDLEKDFKDTVSKWDKKPRFKITYQIIGNKVSYTVYTDSKQYLYVSGGTRKHGLEPKNKKALKLIGVRNKTLSLVSWVTVGLIKKPVFKTKSFTTGVFVRHVKHPGIKKREYPKKIMAKRKPEFSPRMHAAIRAALAKNGQGV